MCYTSCKLYLPWYVHTSSLMMILMSYWLWSTRPQCQDCICRTSVGQGVVRWVLPWCGPDLCCCRGWQRTRDIWLAWSVWPFMGACSCASTSRIRSHQAEPSRWTYGLSWKSSRADWWCRMLVGGECLCYHKHTSWLTKICQHHQSQYPTLSCMAREYLPIQGSNRSMYIYEQQASDMWCLASSVPTCPHLLM